MEYTPPAKRDKRSTLDEMVAGLEDGMTIGIAGWGSRRKPMALVRAILRSDLKDLTVVCYGGPDLGLLCSAGKVKRAYYGFVSLDSAPFYDPWFARRRTEGALEVREMDEGMVRAGLQAAAQRLPFMPIRAGLGSSVIDFWEGELATVDSPYGFTGPIASTEGEHETLLAMPALRLDAALIHLDKADKHGNAAYTGVDPYMDDLFANAADKVLLEVDEIVDSADALLAEVGAERMLLSRMQVDAVTEAPNGAHFTFAGSYGRDEAFQRHYAQAAADDSAWSEFQREFLSGSEQEYQAAVSAFAEKVAAEKAAKAAEKGESK